MPPHDTLPVNEQFVSLGDRLDASGTWIPVPGEPWRQVAATLEQVPRRIRAQVGTSDQGEQVLVLTFTYRNTVKEKQVSSIADDDSGKNGVRLVIGAESDLVYGVELKLMDLSAKSIDLSTDGMRACFHRYGASQKLSLGQQAILESMWTLLRNLLPEIAAKLRSQGKP